MGRKGLSEVATAALPDTILKWYRRLVARKFDGSCARRAAGRPQIGKEIEELIVRMAKDCWGVSQSGLSGFGSNGRQCSAAPRHTVDAGAQANDHLGRIHSSSPSGAGERISTLPRCRGSGKSSNSPGKRWLRRVPRYLAQSAPSPSPATRIRGSRRIQHFSPLTRSALGRHGCTLVPAKHLQ